VRPRLRILHLEDNLTDAELVRELIAAEWPDCEIKVVSTRFTFSGELGLNRYDLILADFSLASFNGLEALSLAVKSAPETPFIFLSGTLGEDCAIEAVRSGAHDYVLKDRMKRLLTVIPRALQEAEERRRRRQAESRVRELAEMVNQAREAIIITDLQGRIISWNAGAEHLFGWKSDEVLGKASAEIFSDDMHQPFSSSREETATKGAWSGEMHLHARSGNAVIVESRQTLIRDEAGAPRAYLSINSDITDRKRLEEQFLRAQRMENIGLLAAGIAHDLNNVLAPMLMAAPMLREWVAEPAGLRMIDLLEKSAERGSGLVRQILAFAQGVSSEHRLVQAKTVLREIVAVVAGTFPKIINLEENIPGELWPMKASPIQLHQVLLNLCVNARDAMPEGGTLRLQAQNCLLDPDSALTIPGGFAGAFVVLHVEDTGTGIAPAVLERMWEPFYTTKESDKGTGLGLSTVRGIVKSHGGFMEVRTELGRGTAFRAYFPAAENAGPSAVPDSARPPARAHGELILVVEDSPDIREMTAAMLTRNGYRVVLAADGAEAVTIFNQRGAEIRLVISDVRMPNLDGAMLARVLHRLNPAVKMLVVSGHQHRAPWSNSPWPVDFVGDFLPKPFKPEVLLRKVRDMIHASPPKIGAA
jgi:two-component system, cell cycle sensor histidine kinase and response regulator CckA